MQTDIPRAVNAGHANHHLGAVSQLNDITGNNHEALRGLGDKDLKIS
jgi:hypothetical protein